MLAKWMLANYKSVYSRTELDLKPLTLFVGANNAGKSTFIQSMLLVAQTLSDQLTSRPVVLNGRMVRVGTFSGIVSAGSGSREVMIGFRSEHNPRHLPPGGVLNFFPSRSAYYWPTDGGSHAIECEFRFTSPGSGSDDALDLQTTVTECRVRFQDEEHDSDTVVHVKPSVQSIEEKMARALPAESDSNQPLLDSLRLDVIVPTQIPERLVGVSDHFPSEGAIVGATLSHFVPTALTVAYDAEADAAGKLVRALLRGRERGVRDALEQYGPGVLPILERVSAILRRILKASVDEQRARNYNAYTIDRALKAAEGQSPAAALMRLVETVRLVPEARAEIVATADDWAALLRRDRPPRPTLGAIPLDWSLHQGMQQVFSEEFRYLAPLRDEPKAVYPFDGMLEPGSVGLRGEYTAAALELYRNLQVSYLRPGALRSSHAAIELTHAPLHAAVTEWLDYLGVVRAVRTADKGVFGHELTVAVHGDDAFHTLPHVGVGVSQVLPILVMSLLCNPGTTLVFEQPELHLHPSVQARLGDFFIALSLGGKQCIVETHSEYLINRLRLRAAEDPENRLADLSRLYFVEKLGRESTYRPGAITEFGALTEWPKGFFDQGPEDARLILLAAIAKRAERARNCKQ